MLTRIQAKTLAIATGLLVSTAGVAHAQDCGPLVDLLVKKGIVSDQEGEELKTELTKSFVANSSAGKLNLSSSLSEFKLSGDVRIRHQEEVQAVQGSENLSNERTRERFRFRFNGDAKLQGGWGAGFALETGQASDSGNQTFDNGGDDYSIFLARAYVSYAPTNDLYFTAGKFVNPLYTTDLVWDADINPQGFGETWQINDSFKLVAMQGIMKDNAETAWGASGRDAWQFSQQLVYTTKFDANTVLTLAPGFMTYNQSTLSGLTNETPWNGTTRYLEVFTLPGDVKISGINGEGTSLKVYWDYAHNFAASDRVHKAYAAASTFSNDADAWLVGVGYNFGAGKTKGDWGVKLDYREIGIGSIDPNTSDSDFGFGHLNQRGFKFGAVYNVTDYATLGATYFYTFDKQGTLKTSVSNLDHSQILQLDLVVKF